MSEQASTARPRKRRRGGGSRSRLSGWRLLAARIAFGVGLIILWEITVRVGYLDKTVTSSPYDVGSYLWNATQTPELWNNLSATMLAVAIAFVLASIAGVAIGMALALLPTVEVVVSPYLDALNAMPRIALAPVFVVVFGLTIHSKVALAFSIVVFIVLTATRAGVRSVDIDLMRLSESLGANKWQMFSKILLPVATPAIFGALRLGVIYSLLGVVTSELIAAREGIGQVLQQSASLFKIDAVYGILILLAVIATVLNLGMVKLEQWILRWQPPNS